MSELVEAGRNTRASIPIQIIHILSTDLEIVFQHGPFQFLLMGYYTWSDSIGIDWKNIA